MGFNWLVVIDAYSKYPCIHQTTSTSTAATIALLEEDFAHFGYPHTLVTDNATTFTSEEFQEWCKAKGITHLTGAPYHPATNGAAERLVQTFKNAIKKSSQPPKKALLEFLIQYRRTPLPSGYSPSELLNGRQIRAMIDTIIPSPTQQVQALQQKQANRSQMQRPHKYVVGTPCYALYFGPKRDRDPKWIPAIVTKVYGARSVNVKVLPRGPTWRRHIEQLQPRYASEDDNEPGDYQPPSNPASTTQHPSTLATDDVNPDENIRGPEVTAPDVKPRKPNPRMPTGSDYGPGNPRRSTRHKQAIK
jgi:hypothetical protein